MTAALMDWGCCSVNIQRRSPLHQMKVSCGHDVNIRGRRSEGGGARKGARERVSKGAREGEGYGTKEDHAIRDAQQSLIVTTSLTFLDTLPPSLPPSLPSRLPSSHMQMLNFEATRKDMYALMKKPVLPYRLSFRVIVYGTLSSLLRAASVALPLGKAVLPYH